MRGACRKYEQHDTACTSRHCIKSWMFRRICDGIDLPANGALHTGWCPRFASQNQHCTCRSSVAVENYRSPQVLTGATKLPAHFSLLSRDDKHFPLVVCKPAAEYINQRGLRRPLKTGRVVRLMTGIGTSMQFSFQSKSLRQSSCLWLRISALSGELL